MHTTTVSGERQSGGRSFSCLRGEAEGAVLTHLLDEHPRRLSLEDLAREFDPDLDAPAVQRAIDNLTAACLLRREGSTVVPAPAVVGFDRFQSGRA